MTDNTVFDSVFRTMVEKTPELVIPLINEAFGRSYPDDVPFEQYRNEHETEQHRIITESIFKVEGKLYHIECQSVHDARMVVRMVEYDFAIALEQAIRNGVPYRIRFPESCILYLRDAPTQEKLTMEMELPNGTICDYETRVVNSQSYGQDELFAKRLLMLMPFYIMRFEGDIDAIADDTVRTELLIAECERLRKQLERVTLSQDKALLYEQLVELAVRISDHILAKQETLRRKVRISMGGEILELMSDRIAAAEE